MSSAVDGRHRRTLASRAAIIDAAERLFGTDGFTATSLRTIAGEIGMTHAGILKHFPSKGDLLLAVLQKLEPGNGVAALDTPPDAPRAEVLRLLLERTQSQVAALNLRIVLLGEATEESHPGHSFVREQLRIVELELSEVLGTDGVELLAVWNGLQLLHKYLPSLDTIAIAIAHVDPAPADSSRPAAQTVAPLKHAPAREPASRAQQIVAAAAGAFSRAGYRATSLRDIAADLGISHGAVLYHFPTKVDLLEAVLDERDRDESLPWTIGEGPLDYLHGMYLQALHNESEPGLARLYSTLVSEATEPGHPAHSYFAERYARFHAEIVHVLEDLKAQGHTREGIDVGDEAWTLIALWDGLALREFYLPDDRGLPERLRRRLNSVLEIQLAKAEIPVDQ